MKIGLLPLLKMVIRILTRGQRWPYIAPEGCNLNHDTSNEVLPMKFQVNWPFGSGEEGPFRFSR